MPIQILPLQLANQIAAGEVVERPASVVKELIENSLDAGALQIEVDIENGGSQLIRIRDNGAGIAQQELALALTRHATSKITSLEDLQAVTSLGFRGEALASIHAVSRLSITSRIAQHSQAWQIYAEGRDSATRVKPVAHPLGTTLEVRDLFYNTPVRRKFLRSAKTEFAHIDEVVRRIALAHFPIGFILNHNGKRIRHYRPVAPEAVLVPRLAALCGQPFAEQALVVLWRNPLLTVTGWIAVSTELKGGSDIQYSYVNGRVIRDKVINHAIRQACHEHCTAQHTPAFVLFLEIDPQQVDVNVHPTKQEVRFHHARAVHDAIYQAVCQSLSSTADPSAALSQVDIKQTTTAAAPHVQSAASILPRPLSAGSVQAVGRNQKPVAYYPDDCHQSKKWNSKKIAPYRQLLQITSVQAEKPIRESAERFDITQCSKSTAVASCSLGRVLMVWQQQYALLERQYECALLSLPVAQRYLYQTQLVQQQGPGRGQALLIPQVLPDLSVQQMEGLQRYHPVLAQLGIKLQLQSCSVIVQALPMLLQQQDRIGLLLSVLEYWATSAQKDALDLAEWLARQLTMPVIQWHVAQAIQLLADLEHALPSVLAEPSPALLQSVDLTAASTLLAHYA